MKHVVFIGSHLGYSMHKTPLGGGAMVGLELTRHWARKGGFRLTVLGSGPVPPCGGCDYRRLAVLCLEGTGEEDGLVRLSEFGYARFCREFEAAAISWLRSELRGRACVVLNDISEGPDPAAVSRLGHALMSVWHVDVVDYFNKMYFHNLLPPERVAALFDGLSSAGLRWALPDVLRLVFEKQRRTVEHADRLVVPSKRMAETIVRCYGRLRANGRGAGLRDRIEVIPWGVLDEEAPGPRVLARCEELRRLYRIGPDARVIMTLSRIAPEKGILLLIEALRLLEAGAWPRGGVCLLVAGLPAFMRGGAYTKRVRAAAARLRRTRVHFPGYLSGVEKAAHFRLAHLFVSPSIHESYGLSIVEAMQAGLPVLASDHSGVDEILLPGFSRVVPYNGLAGKLLGTFGWRGDIPRRLSESLAALLADPAGLKAMGLEARAAAGRMPFSAAADRLAGAALALLA